MPASDGGGLDLPRGSRVGDRIVTARGQIFEWTGEAWLWLPNG